MPDRAILVVEDHAESRTSLSYVLEKRGYRVHQAANGRAAIAVARRERLHGVVLDLNWTPFSSRHPESRRSS
jgi:CheY-like chemotaxis protein